MKLLLIPIIIVLLGTISTVIFIGCGYLISLVISLTLFQASLLCIGTTFLLVLTIVIIVAGVMITEYIQTSDYEEEEADNIFDMDRMSETFLIGSTFIRAPFLGW